MSVLHLLATEPTAYAAGYVLGTGRGVPTAAAVVALAGVVIGALSVRRAHLLGGVTALVLGLLSTAVGGLHAANAAGGLGTGNGLAGAVVAVALGLIAMVIGALTVARSRR